MLPRSGDWRLPHGRCWQVVLALQAGLKALGLHRCCQGPGRPGSWLKLLAWLLWHRQVEVSDVKLACVMLNFCSRWYILLSM